MNTDENNFNSIFARNLRNYLNANNMTQVELSKKLDVGTTSVYNWCNGIKTPRMDKVDKMCQIFGCKRSDLITDSYAPDDIPESMELYLKYKEEAPDFIKKAAILYSVYQSLSPEKQAAFDNYIKFLQSDA